MSWSQPKERVPDDRRRLFVRTCRPMIIATKGAMSSLCPKKGGCSLAFLLNCTARSGGRRRHRLSKAVRGGNRVTARGQEGNGGGYLRLRQIPPYTPLVKYYVPGCTVLQQKAILNQKLFLTSQTNTHVVEAAVTSTRAPFFCPLCDAAIHGRRWCVVRR